MNGIVCSISGNETGADIENIIDDDEQFFSSVLSADEMRLLKSSDEPDVDITAIWTLKEAIGKFRRTGLAYDLQTESFAPVYDRWYKREGLDYYTSRRKNVVFSVCRSDRCDISEITNEMLSEYLVNHQP